jgi:hypothetical protein
MAFDLKKAVAQAKQKGPDMTEAQKGGGYELPAQGFVRLRLVGYFEVGKHESEFQGKKKVNDRVELVFELSGPKHLPRVNTDTGEKYPQRITVKQPLSRNEKSNFFKLFTTMNYEKSATHMAELLGQAFVADITHNKKNMNGNDVTFANLENIRKPFAVNPETGDEYKLEVDPPLTPLKLFLWDFADADMWDAIYIDGQYDEEKNDKGEVTRAAKSKNILQNKIMSALNWKGSPVYAYATTKATPEEAAALDEATGGDAEEPARDDAPAGPDAMEGIA